MTDNEANGFTPPYLPFSNITGLLQRMRETGAPGRIDRSYLSWLPGINQTYLMAALRDFGLTDEKGYLSPKLKDLISASLEEEKAAIAELVKSYYSEVFELGMNATQAQLEGVFRDKYGVKGSTLRKAITFFLKGSEYGGVPVSPHFKSPRTASTPASARRGSRKKGDAYKPPGRPEDHGTSDKSGEGLPALRKEYITMLMKKAEEEPTEELFDRIERLLGYQEGGGA